MVKKLLKVKIFSKEISATVTESFFPIALSNFSKIEPELIWLPEYI